MSNEHESPAGFSPFPTGQTAGAVSPDGTAPAPFPAYPWIEGEGPYRLQGVDWKAIADGDAA